MKVTFTTNNGRMTAEFDVDTQTDLFEQLAYFQEIFGEEQCAKCGSENLRFQVRKVEDNLYYELKCVDCGAKLAFGTMKVGCRLFPRRKDKEGNWLPDRGWVKWNKETQQEE